VRRVLPRSWFVYLVECRDGTLYTGVAIDVRRRVAEHNAGRGARYTRGRAPVRVVAASRALDKRAAYRLEWAVKRQPARAKAAALRARRARPAPTKTRVADRIGAGKSRRSIGPQRDHRIDEGGAAGRQPGRRQRDAEHE